MQKTGVLQTGDDNGEFHFDGWKLTYLVSK